MKNKITILTMFTIIFITLFSVTACTKSNETTEYNVVTTTNYNYELPDDWWEKTWYDTGMYMANTLQYRSSNYDLESVLKISSNYTVWVDKDRIDGSDYDIKFTFADDMLTGGIYKDGAYLSSGIKSPVDVDLNDTIGDYIYVQFVGMNWGTILLDSNQTYTKSVTEIYEYVMNRDLDIKYLHPFEASEAPLVEGYNELIETYYSHVNNFSCPLKTYVTVVDFNNLEQTCNPEITYQQTICPDDDKEDAESEYNIQLIDTVYMSAGLFAPSFINTLSDVILLKNGEYCDEKITATCSYPNMTNTEDFNVYMTIQLPDGVWYKKTIEVKIIDTQINVGYVVFEDGTLIVTKSYNNNYTIEEFAVGIDNFLSTQMNLENANIQIPADFTFLETKTYTGAKYNEYDIKIINSGLGSLLFSSEDEPIDDSDAKEGISIVSEIYYTSNFSTDDVIQAIGDNFILVDGLKPEEDFKIIATHDHLGLHLEIHIFDDIINWYNIQLYEVTDSTVGNYILAKHRNFANPIIYVEQKINNNIQAINIFIEVFEKHHFATSVYSLELNVDLTVIAEHEVSGLYVNGASNYYNLAGIFEIINLQDKINNTNVEWYVEPEPEEEYTNYSIKEIDTIYLHSYVNLDGLLDLLKSDLLLKDGVECYYDYTISARMWNDVDYGDEFEIEIYVRYPDDVTRTFMVNIVKIPTGNLKVGLIHLNDGSILVGTSSKNEYTSQQMASGLISIISRYINSTVFIVGIDSDWGSNSYMIYRSNRYWVEDDPISFAIGVTGSTAIINSTADMPVDDDAAKQGYVIYDTVYYTSDYKLEDVLSVIGQYLLLNNGIPVNADYKVYMEFNSTNQIEVEITYNSNILITGVINLKIVDDSTVGSFIYADTMLFSNSLLIIEGAKNSDYSFEDIFAFMMTEYNKAWEVPEIDTIINLDDEGRFALKGIYYKNVQYWNYYMDVKIIDFENELEDSNVDFEDEFLFPDYPNNPNPSDPSDDSIDSTEGLSIIKIIVMVFSAVVGVIAIIIIVKGFKKVLAWLK